MRKLSRKSIVKKLDSIVKEIVILRDKRCIQCGTTQSLTPGHVFSRRGYSTRWDLRNVWAQCRNCNLKHVYSNYPYFQEVSKRMGVKGLDKLHQEYVTARPTKTWELISLHEELQLVRDGYKKGANKRSVRFTHPRGGTTMSGLTKISEPERVCLSPEHNPPDSIDSKPGTYEYEYVCPVCGKKTVINVPLITC